ncbi:uncharacterized protein [Ptychodera flava]|uniref:uncharacterized protein n=1 Tax=Ptychodera flava TaxID=63121 RepID=UPI00396A50FD
MSRLSLVCLLLVALCAVLAISEAKAIEKDALAGKLVAALRAKAAQKKHAEEVESESMKRRKSILTQKRKELMTKKSEELETSTKDKRDGVKEAETLTAATDVLSGVLNGGKKRGLSLALHGKKDTTKKSYYEVFMVGDFLLSVIGAFEMAPCTVGLHAMADIMENDVNWESIDWTTLHEDDVEPYILAFIEWWDENKCTEFFTTEWSFYQFVWSIFWDDLEETECYWYLPRDDDGTVDWTSAFDKVNSLDPAAWESYPEPETECDLFEMVGEIYFDFFFIHFFSALPDNVLEEIYNDYGVNDLIDPYFGYEHFAGSV